MWKEEGLARRAQKSLYRYRKLGIKLGGAPFGLVVELPSRATSVREGLKKEGLLGSGTPLEAVPLTQLGFEQVSGSCVERAHSYFLVGTGLIRPGRRCILDGRGQHRQALRQTEFAAGTRDGLLPLRGFVGSRIFTGGRLEEILQRSPETSSLNFTVGYLKVHTLLKRVYGKRLLSNVAKQ